MSVKDASLSWWTKCLVRLLRLPLHLENELICCTPSEQLEQQEKQANSLQKGYLSAENPRSSFETCTCPMPSPGAFSIFQ